MPAYRAQGSATGGFDDAKVVTEESVGGIRARNAVGKGAPPSEPPKAQKPSEPVPSPSAPPPPVSNSRCATRRAAPARLASTAKSTCAARTR